jgi:hypothetical protein
MKGDSRRGCLEECVSEEFRREWWAEFSQTHPEAAKRLIARHPERYPLPAPAHPVATVIPILRPRRKRRRLPQQLDDALRSDAVRRAGLVVLLALALVTPAAAQAPACHDLLACQRERVADFKDYVEHLQSEIAFCKAINKGHAEALRAKDAEIRALQQQLAEQESK